MTYAVKMVDKVNLINKTWVTCATIKEALSIQRHMNMLNAEAAKMTGKAIRVFYKVVKNG